MMAAGQQEKHRRHSVQPAEEEPQKGWCVTRGGRTVLGVVMAGLALATLVVYWGIWNSDFVDFDDTQYVTDNRHVKDGLTVDGINWAFTTFHASNWHPLTWISHMLDMSLFGMWAGGHHITNLVLHIMSTLLLFSLLRYTTGRLWASTAVAALFALHPLHVESVAWISERKDVLSALFWMLTMWAYVLYARKPGLLRYATVVLAFALGLMSKPMLVTLPVILLLLDYWPLKRFEIAAEGGRLRIKGGDLRRLLLEKAPLAAMAVISAAVTVIAQRTATAKLDVIDVGPRITNVFVSYARYIVEMLWPADLVAFYPYKDKPQYPAALAALVFLAAASIAAVYLSRRLRYVLVGWLWYVITLIPVIGIIRVGSQSHADRYTYIPLIGIFIIIAWGIGDIIRRRPQLARLTVVAAAMVLICAGIMAHLTSRQWRNTYALSLRAATVKQSFRMLLILASSQIDRGELQFALASLKEAQKLRPDDPELLSTFGRAMLRMKRFPEAVGYYDEAMKAAADRREIWLNKALALYGMGKTEEAEAHVRKAAELDPYWAVPYSELGRMLGETGGLDEGIAAYQKALELDPMLAEAHSNLSVLYMRKGDFESAAKELRTKLNIEPDASAWSNLGGCMVALNRLDEAEAAYRQSIGMQPDNAAAHYNLGVVLASNNRISEALAEVRKAIELDPKDLEKREYYRKLAGASP